MRSGSQVLWSIVATRPPASLGEYLLLLALPLLVVLGGAALAWPWLTGELPRLLAAGLAVVQQAVQEVLPRLAGLLGRSG